MKLTKKQLKEARRPLTKAEKRRAIEMLKASGAYARMATFV